MNRIIYKEGSDKLLYICISFTLIYVVMKKIIIAIDGVSSTGKSTMAKDLARELGYTYIDTGAMYRAMALYFLRQGIDSHDEAAIGRACETVYKRWYR